MAVQCANCGEELMGSVNRCWRCGRPFVSRSGPAQVPPIRRNPIIGPVDGPMEAIVLEGDEPGGPDEPHEADLSPARRWHRRGSPFAGVDSANGAEGSQTELPVETTPRAAEYDTRRGAVGSSAGAILLALISLAVGWVFSVGAIILAAAGLFLSVWGLRGQRQVAIFALVLCCFAFAAASFIATIDLFTIFYGVSPWQYASS